MRSIWKPEIRQAGAGAVSVAAMLALLAPGASAAPAQPPAPATASYEILSADACADDQEIGFLGLINEYRASSGLGPLSISASLSSAAAYHSIDMAAAGYLDHTLIDGTSVQQNMANFGYPGGLYGENIAAGMETALEAMQTWQGSAEHNANMLNGSFGAIGIGRAYDPASPYGWYWTTIFGGESDGPGWLCGEAAPPSKSVSLFQSVDGATSASDVNLRSGPGADYAQVTTLAPNTPMTVTGREQNGYLPVKVDGKFGWVAAEWVQRGPISLEQPAAPTGAGAGTATAVDAVELLSAPAAASGVLANIPTVAVVTLTGEAQDGFLGVVFDGQQGWADAAYLEVADVSSGTALLQTAEQPVKDLAAAAPVAVEAPVGAQAAAVADVNLRSQPSAGSPVLDVVPAGSLVSLTGSRANGYVNVRVNGQAGWIDEAYLQ